ncbi:MAG: hypothetical protein JW874_08000 [Spirochaetales bacterium]|nr:hypothetical protein [Spirochaetales bacterium]
MSVFKKIHLAAFFLFAVSYANADLYTGIESLYQIRTEHFRFIFPPESREAAEYLATRAEDIYREVAELLDVPMDLHIPVVFSPDTDLLNGYFTAYPGNRIVLYEAAELPNAGFTRYNNNLEKLFMHELTHAVSLNVRSPVYRFLSAIIGDPLAPAWLTAPPVLVEGVTVSFESLDGYGRANETPYASLIQQDIIEGKFRSFQKASDSAWYEYGGWFSRYLQEIYGMDTYAAFWKELGNMNGVHDFLFFKGAFHTAFGLKVDEAWEGFRKWMQIKVPVVTETQPLQDRYFSLSALAAHGQYVYYAGPYGIYRYDTASGTNKKLFRRAYVQRLDVSEDGKKLLVSTYTYKEDTYRTIILEYDLERRKKTGTIRGGYSEAAFDGDGILAVRLKGYTADLVSLRDGNETVLFSGTSEMIPSVPYRMENGDVQFLVQIRGETRLARIGLDGKIRLLAADIPLTGIKNVFSDGRETCFIYDNDFTLFKLGRLNDAGLFLQKTPISGGIQFPVTADGGIYYAGYFSEGRKLMKYPQQNPALLPEETAFRWEESAPLTITDSVFPKTNTEDMKIMDYNRLWNALFPQFRIPLAKLDWSAGTADKFFRGAGFTWLSSDPTEGLALYGELSYLWNSPFMYLYLGLDRDVWPFTVSLDLYDRQYFNMYSASGLDGRVMGLDLGLWDVIRFSPDQRTLLWTIDGGLEVQGGGEYGTNPYEWELGPIIIPFSVYFEYEDVQTLAGIENSRYGFLFGAGYAGFFDSSDWDWPEAYAEGVFSLYLPVANFRNNFTAAFAAHDQVELQPGNMVLSNGASFYSGFGYPGFYEYEERTDLGGWYFLYGDAGFAPRLKIEKAVFPQLYLRAIYLSAGYRYAYIDDTWLDALYGRLVFDLTVDYGVLNFFPLYLGLEISCPFRENNGDPLLYRIVLGAGGLPGSSVEKARKKRESLIH